MNPEKQSYDKINPFPFRNTPTAITEDAQNIKYTG